MLHVAQHDRRRKPLQRFITSTNHSGFSTSVRSTRFPFAMLRPRAEKDVHVWGRFGKSAWASEVGTITKRGPGPDMKSTTFFCLAECESFERDCENTRLRPAPRIPTMQ